MPRKSSVLPRKSNVRPRKSQTGQDEQEPSPSGVDRPKDDLFRGVLKSTIVKAIDSVLQMNAVTMSKTGAKIHYLILENAKDFGELLPVYIENKPRPDEYDSLEKVGLFPIFAPGAPHNGHFRAGFGRFMAEHVILALAKQESTLLGRPLSLVDIGSNASRLRTSIASLEYESYIDSVHHVIPVIQTGDAQRRDQVVATQIKSRLMANRSPWDHCGCLIEVCPHHAGKDLLLAQHSMYYVDPRDWIRIIGDRKLFASLHVFNDACGTMAEGELSYYVDEAGLVNCTARGNRQRYVHPPNAWLDSNGVEYQGLSLIWDLHGEFFDTRVYVFRVIAQVVKNPKDVEWSQDMVRSLNGNLVNINVVDPTVCQGGNLVTVPIRKLTYKYGIPIVTFVGEKTIMIPRELVGSISLKLAGVNRDAASLATAFDMARRFLAKADYPKLLSAKIITIAVTMALVANLQESTATLGRSNALFNRLFETHNATLKLNPVKSYCWTDSFRLLNPMLWCSPCDYDRHGGNEADTFTQLRNKGLGPRTTLPVHFVEVDATFAPSYEFKTKQLPPVRRGNTIEVLDQHADDSSPSVTLMLIGLGPTFTTSHRRTKDLYQGFRVRLLRDTPDVKSGLWGEYAKKLTDKTSILSLLVPSDKIVMTSKLYNDWVIRYPENLRKRFDVARENLRIKGFSSNLCVATSFIKVEKSAIIWPGEEAVLDPRVIQSFKPELVASVGPLVWKRSTYVRNHLNMTEKPVFWVTGSEATLDNFGRLFGDAVRACGQQAQFVLGDHSKFEAHKERERTEFHTTVAKACIDDALFYQFLDGTAEFTSYSRSGSLKVKACYELASGKPETSVTNAEGNLVGLVHAFGEPAFNQTYFFLNGDDWLVVTNKTYDEQQIHVAFSQLGLESSVLITKDITKVEFCQLVPYPVGAPDTYVFGPKIGRLLTRLPWRTSSSTDEDPYGVCMGLFTNVQHVPFVKEYVDRILEFVSPSSKVAKIEVTRTTSRLVAYDDFTLAFVFARYGLSVGDLDQFVLDLSKITDLRTNYNWARLEAIVLIDE